MRRAFKKRREARRLTRLARATRKPSAAGISVIPDGDGTGTINMPVNNHAAGAESESDKWDGSNSEWAAEYRYMRRAKTRRGAWARAAVPRLNHVLTYNKFGPQYARKRAENARITMDWALKRPEAVPGREEINQRPKRCNLLAA
jgi:hypothetical protein